VTSRSDVSEPRRDADQDRARRSRAEDRHFRPRPQRLTDSPRLAPRSGQGGSGLPIIGAWSRGSVRGVAGGRTTEARRRAAVGTAARGPGPGGRST
jgi:hypothetical protein